MAQGGFGHTYLAEDLTFSARHHCVVKHLSPSKENLPHLARIKDLFEREADTLAKLSLYSNLIPKLIDRFEEAGELYLVQEFIDGVPLSAELTPGKKLTEEATIELLIQILIPLEYCHRENLLHRDLKPDNIMRRRQTGELVLIDFGIAKDMEAGSITHKSYGGTPGYAPEEQQHGFPELASDVYAVGMIGIQALTGMSPVEFRRKPQTMEWDWDKYCHVSYCGFILLHRMIHPSVDRRYQNAQDTLVAIQSLQFDKHKLDRFNYDSTRKSLVKSNVKGKTPTQMWEDLLEWNKFIETAPTEDRKTEKAKQLGIIDSLPFTFIMTKSIDIDFKSIESNYREIEQALRDLAPEIWNTYFPINKNIYTCSDYVYGFIPLTTIRLARLKDIYESSIYVARLPDYNDWSHIDRLMPVFAEIFAHVDSYTRAKMMEAISKLTGDIRRHNDFSEIPYILETVHSDAGQNDFYLFSCEDYY